MSVRDTRFIVVTNSITFFNTLRVEIAGAAKVGLILNVVNINTIENKFSVSGTNIVILDTDQPSNVTEASSKMLKHFSIRYNLLIIPTGTSIIGSNNLNDFIVKPKILNNLTAKNYVKSIIFKIENNIKPTTLAHNINTNRHFSEVKNVAVNQKICVIASSTGGTEALEKILKELPANFPPILIVQHMPHGFTKFFADRLNPICNMHIKEAEHLENLEVGKALIAPAGMHMVLALETSHLVVKCFRGEKINGVMPAADVLFDSVAKIMKHNVLGVILTGMGGDGAKGLLKMRMLGAKTIGQDKETCVVYGMPKIAFEIGAIEKQLPLDKIAGEMIRCCI